MGALRAPKPPGVLGALGAPSSEGSVHREPWEPRQPRSRGQHRVREAEPDARSRAGCRRSRAPGRAGCRGRA
eukprot:3887421-Alexandrium_andersonii.AAC.1